MNSPISSFIPAFFKKIFSPPPDISTRQSLQINGDVGKGAYYELDDIHSGSESEIKTGNLVGTTINLPVTPTPLQQKILDEQIKKTSIPLCIDQEEKASIKSNQETSKLNVEGGAENVAQTQTKSEVSWANKSILVYFGAVFEKEQRREPNKRIDVSKIKTIGDLKRKIVEEFVKPGATVTLCGGLCGDGDEIELKSRKEYLENACYVQVLIKSAETLGS